MNYSTHILGSKYNHLRQIPHPFSLDIGKGFVSRSDNTVQDCNTASWTEDAVAIRDPEQFENMPQKFLLYQGEYWSYFKCIPGKILT